MIDRGVPGLVLVLLAGCRPGGPAARPAADRVTSSDGRVSVARPEGWEVEAVPVPGILMALRQLEGEGRIEVARAFGSGGSPESLGDPWGLLSERWGARGHDLVGKRQERRDGGQMTVVDSVVRGRTGTLRERQYVIWSGSTAVVVAAAAPESRYRELVPVFDAVAESVELGGSK